MTDFGNLKADSGLEKLNAHLLSHSYITGSSATQDDTISFAKLLGPPPAGKYPHALRWYKHIYMLGEEQRSAWPKGKISATPVEKSKDAPEKFDLFGGDDKAVEVAAKAVSGGQKKKEVINKSSLVIEIKPNDVSTDLEQVWKMVKKIKINGVTWGQNYKKVPIAFGLYKLQVSCVILDDLVNTEDITDQIEALGMDLKEAEERKRKRECEDEDEEEEESSGLVQSADIASFNKL